MNSSLYIHIPFCKKKCAYCDFFSVGERDRSGKINDLSDAYISSLVKEAGIYAEFYGIKKWNSLYVGGGTPSILSPAQISDLISGAGEIAELNADAEVTVEMNPDDVREEFLDACRDSGVNRLSMGIQAFDDGALSAVGRGSSVEIICRALEILDKNWQGRLSVDFIAGLPCHTYRSFEKQFELLKKYPKIDHVSLYTLTVEENTPLWKEIEDGKIKFSYEKADRMWMKGRNILEKLGFRHYEVSNFARQGFESRHNSTYWKQENYVGIGAGASGTVYDFDLKSAVRWTNSLSIPAYIRGVGQEEKSASKNLSFLKRNVEKLDEKLLEFEFLMLGFRRLAGVSCMDYEKRFGKNLSERIGADGENGLFSKWKKNRLATEKISPNGDRIFSLNRRGILLLNRFLEELI
ncbi:MAG: radical SAM family heme chaperone HemW [Treponema sp.]|nr:radical SAM family heme chaperone HemW [Treponema sp.]